MSWKLAIYFKTKFSYIYLDDDVIWQFFQRASSRKWRLYLNIIKVKFSVKSEEGSKVKTSNLYGTWFCTFDFIWTYFKIQTKNSWHIMYLYIHIGDPRKYLMCVITFKAIHTSKKCSSSPSHARVRSEKNCTHINGQKTRSFQLPCCRALRVPFS